MQRLIDFPADAFFFDFDGTLGDTSGGIKAGWRKTLEELGISCPDFESIFRVGPPPETMIKSLLPDAPAELQQLCVNTYKKIYDNSAMDGEKPYPWSRDILQKLKERERKIYVVTYKRLKSTLTLIERYKFSHFFSGIYTADIIPGVPLLSKSELLKLAVRISGVPADRCIMIGDTEMDIQAGKDAAIHTCGVSWGYGDPAGAEFII